MRLRFIRCLLAVLAAGSVRCDRPPTPAEPLSHALASGGVAWQPLPPEVEDVDVAGGTVWLTVQPRGDPPPLARVKADLAAQWGQRVAVSRWAEVLLAEPGGRVWFQIKGRLPDADFHLLLAYDGQTWVEKLPPMYSPRGKGPPKRATWWAEPVHADGSTFFATTSHHVLWYDGRDWHEHALYPSSGHASARFPLVVAANGDVTLFTNVGPRAVHRFDGRRWAEQTMDAADLTGPSHQVAPSTRATYVCASERLYELPVPTAATTRPVAREVEYAEGRPIRGCFFVRVNAAGDVEAGVELGLPGEAFGGRFTRNPYEQSGQRALLQISPGGGVRVVATDDDDARLLGSSDDRLWPGQITAQDATTLLRSGPGVDPRVRLVDRRTNRLVAAAPDIAYGELCAVFADGTVILRRKSNLKGLPKLALWRPLMPLTPATTRPASAYAAPD